MPFQKGHKGIGGRPRAKHNIESEKMREFVIQQVKRELGPIIKAQIDLAKGIAVKQQIVTEDGQVLDRYYILKPDSNAAKYLLDQTIGKAKEPIELSGTMETLVSVVEQLDRN